MSVLYGTFVQYLFILFSRVPVPVFVALLYQLARWVGGWVGGAIASTPRASPPPPGIVAVRVNTGAGLL